jgi:hypothetical protein
MLILHNTSVGVAQACAGPETMVSTVTFMSLSCFDAERINSSFAPNTREYVQRLIEGSKRLMRLLVPARGLRLDFSIFVMSMITHR